jgi:hypothetical protein
MGRHRYSARGWQMHSFPFHLICSHFAAVTSVFPRSAAEAIRSWDCPSIEHVLRLVRGTLLSVHDFPELRANPNM